jgi:hypothetical protein
LLLYFVFSGVVHATGGVDDVGGDGWINPKPLGCNQGLAGGHKACGRDIVVECLHGVTRTKRANMKQLATHYTQ